MSHHFYSLKKWCSVDIFGNFCTLREDQKEDVNMTPSVGNVREVCGILVVAVYSGQAMRIFRLNERSGSVSLSGESGLIAVGRAEQQMRESALRAFHTYLAEKTTVPLK
ncbi:MAG: hypothetical protein AAB523_01300 [Patescibacteria group bacterium]